MADSYKFSTPPDFPKPDDVKKDGDVHRFLLDAECTGTDDDGTMHWEMEALDGVKLPENDGDEESEGDEMDSYDDSADEPSEDAPKDAKGVAALILKPPAQ